MMLLVFRSSITSIATSLCLFNIIISRLSELLHGLQGFLYQKHPELKPRLSIVAGFRAVFGW